MNITELIVELLQKGQRVELPEIGTFDSVTQAPRHDTASGTYYPATRNIVFRPGTSGDNSMVKIIAERDCVNEDVARQMWVNYTDALNEKIQRTGEHQFGTLLQPQHPYGVVCFFGRQLLTILSVRHIEESHFLHSLFLLSISSCR